MNYGNVAGIGKPVSRVVLGTMVINRQARANSYDLLDTALRLGVNTFDMAHVYGGGDTERCIGDWLADRGCRDRVVLITKGAIPNADRPRVTPYDIEADLHDSLTRLRVPSVDLYFLHRDNPRVPVGPVVEALDRLRREDKITAYGGSNWTHPRLQEANDYAKKHGLAPFAASSPNFGLAEQVDNPWGPGCVTLSGPEHKEARAWYAANHMPIFAYSSLARGLFSGRVDPDCTDPNHPTHPAKALDGAALQAYAHPVNFERLRRVAKYAKTHNLAIPLVALAWLLHHPLDTYALVGPDTAKELTQLTEALTIKLPPADLAHMNLEE